MPINTVDESKLAPHVREQNARNQADAAAGRADQQRTNKIQAAAKTLRDRNLELSRHNSAIGKQISEFKEVAGGVDLVALEAKGQEIIVEGRALESQLAQLRRICGVV